MGVGEGGSEGLRGRGEVTGRGEAMARTHSRVSGSSQTVMQS